MAERRAPLADLPFWPRYLSRDEASRYVGVSPDVFDDEVDAGHWPAARRRGGKGGRLTWDRMALDAAADAASGIGQTETASPAPGSTAWRGRSGTAEGKRALSLSICSLICFLKVVSSPSLVPVPNSSNKIEQMSFIW